MTDEHDGSGIDRMVRGEPERARRLRATLAVVARRTEDEDLRRVIRDVLAGTENVRRALLHPGMTAMAQASLDNLERGLDRLDPDEREDVMSRVGTERTADEEIDAMREATPTSDGRSAPGEDRPGPRRPPTGGTW